MIAKSHITFARVFILVKVDSALLEEVLIDLNDNVIKQSVMYDWKPSLCQTYCSFSHESAKCSKISNHVAMKRG